MVKYKLLLICILYEWNGCNNIFLYLQIYNFFSIRQIVSLILNPNRSLNMI